MRALPRLVWRGLRCIQGMCPSTVTRIPLCPLPGLCQGTLCCQATKTPPRGHHPEPECLQGAMCGCFVHIHLIFSYCPNVIPVGHPVDCLPSELDVGPGIFHILPLKAPTETDVASAKASPKPAKSRAQEGAGQNVIPAV